ncbi:hypothetical protein F0365_06245 [Nonlabens sp. Ci31]|jgi:uncharacterized lipoprotein YajG|uniref:hypothetical protein n=1 Tax=Nonlabens sp. Ci31 TaxID=2608253 RepID=UPI001462D482|nr:hypothetical protein [Nonlabens sp. Ci31]QJP34033.1 hypothetical protein F0365_06245 [Nonlabens sp. Ci31]
MKNIILNIAAVVIAATALTSCRETTETKTIVKEVDSTEATKESEGILERTAKKVDKEVNKEINEEIEKIGDDN